MNRRIRSRMYGGVRGRRYSYLLLLDLPARYGMIELMQEKGGEEMRKKIIFLDVDGTLTDYEKHIPAFAAEAIRKARANGHRVYLCTGRSRAEIYDEI